MTQVFLLALLRFKIEKLLWQETNGKSLYALIIEIVLINEKELILTTFLLNFA